MQHGNSVHKLLGLKTVAARGFTRRRKKSLETGGIWIDFFFSTSLLQHLLNKMIDLIRKKMLNIYWFQNNKETKARHVSIKDEMWSQNKMQNSITIWLTFHHHSWISSSSNICVLPSTFDHMSFWRFSEDNIANDTLLHKLYLCFALQLQDLLLEIFATVELKWLRNLSWHHISCMDYTT